MKINTRLFSALVLGALAVVPQVSATEIFTTTFNAWQQATTGPNSGGNVSIPNNGSYNTASGVTLTPTGSYPTVVVTGTDGSNTYYLSGDGYSTTYNGHSFSSNSLEAAGDGIGAIVFTPSAGVTAATFFLGITGNTAPVTVTLSDGEHYTTTLSPGTSTFVGFSSSTPISSVSLTTVSGSQVQLSDFYFGTSNDTSTPTAPAAEVTTALMIGSGLLLFGARRKVFSNFSRLTA